MQVRSYAPTEYLSLEETSETRHEYWNGEIVEMAGAGVDHVLVSSNTGFALRSSLGGKCKVALSDLRVCVDGIHYVYPDVVVFCSDPELTDERPPSLLNPTLIVEITSESTVEIDKGAKLDTYRKIDSLLEYWILDYKDRRALQCIKRDAEWSLRIHGMDDVIRCDHLDVEVPVLELFTL